MSVQNASSTPAVNPIDVTRMSGTELQSLLQAQASTISIQDERILALTHQLDWFRRQLFGKKSERFAPEPDPAQMHLGEVLPIPALAIQKVKIVPAHTRRLAHKDGAQSGEELPFFDESQVPLESIVLVHEHAKDLQSGEFELIGEKITYRLSQRPGSYVILKYRRPVMKRKDTQEILTAPAPSGFLEGSRADVSFAAGLLMDKFACPHRKASGTISHHQRTIHTTDAHIDLLFRSTDKVINPRSKTIRARYGHSNARSNKRTKDSAAIFW